MGGTGDPGSGEPRPAQPPEADPAPGLLTVVWNLTDEDDLGSAERLAHDFGGFILEPTYWPARTKQPQYVMNPPNPVSPLFDATTYGAAAELPEHPVRLIVTGRRGVSPHRPGRNGWFAVPGLEHVDGLGRDDGLVSHVCLERDGHVVHVTMFPTMDDAVAVARSLRIVEPATSR